MKPFSLNIRAKETLTVSGDCIAGARGHLTEYTHPAVMGVINVTADSFYDASRASSREATCRKAEQMASEGADFIDIGAYSTRPGCSEISEQQEVDSLCEGISAVRAVTDLPISVDTFRSRVARVAIEQCGADIINDISGGNMDAEMFATAAQLHVPYILTHSLGDISHMHQSTCTDVLAEVVRDLAAKVSQLQLLGVCDIIIDPGFGFSKSLEQNYHLLANLRVLQTLHLPILVGVSRKSMITKPLGITAEEALTGTIVINTIAVQQGASILRVHDVKAARQALEILNLTESYA